MKRRKFKRFGPFSYYKCHTKDKHFISAWLTGYENQSWGWEWGHDGYDQSLSLMIRIVGLTLFGFQKFAKGFEIWLFGFWLLK